MKWLVFGIIFIIYNYIILCQDIVFPDDEELSHVGGNSGVITERIPISSPSECPENMLLFPGYGTTCVCDCRPRFLYFPTNDSCHEAYMQGPCPLNYYVVLPKNEAVPRCVENPCLTDGVVQYNGVCYPLRTIGGPCGPEGVLGVNETTFELECVPANVAPFLIIDAPKRRCPAGTRRNSLGICRDII
ncbi:PREDICTED: uncharacterized protein LOC107194934 [Dufourea novaeangliae]|uniref:DUF4789 domain-containing protein n=1 Tax=Dufourea novaeangliae TaxID=178035 RepID=A0A154P2R6_DUFNO|nr:PREDICTED: uncharacterized protein LOC107194934 [Dufourea novaeangliae]KZC06216.1 hypothetical protein WN55_10125 [Dufourea novaeangliae]